MMELHSFVLKEERLIIVIMFLFNDKVYHCSNT